MPVARVARSCGLSHLFRSIAHTWAKAIEPKVPSMARGGARPGAGRPKGRRNKRLRRIPAVDGASITELARQRSPAMIDSLTEIARTGKNESARVSAAIAVLDRGCGKPPMQVDVSKRTHVEIALRSPAELRQALIERGIPESLLPEPPLLLGPKVIEGNDDETK
jgi:hypothetical protein